jgi:hypothetical protein
MMSSDLAIGQHEEEGRQQQDEEQDEERVQHEKRKW